MIVSVVALGETSVGTLTLICIVKNAFRFKQTNMHSRDVQLKNRNAVISKFNLKILIFYKLIHESRAMFST